jgi:hypothetical protein
MDEKINLEKEKKLLYLIFIICSVLTTGLLLISQGGFELKGLKGVNYPISIILMLISSIVFDIFMEFLGDNIIVQYFIEIGFLVSIYIINNLYLIRRINKRPLKEMTIFRKFLPFIFQLGVVWMLSILYWIVSFRYGMEYQGLHFMSVAGIIHYGSLLLLSFALFAFLRYSKYIKAHWHNVIILLFNFSLLIALLFLMFPWLGEPI